MTATVLALGLPWGAVAPAGAGPAAGEGSAESTPGQEAPGEARSADRQAPAPRGEPAPRDGETGSRDLRSTVVFRYECASDLDRREVTLFANGTVRLWKGPPGEEEMHLGELDPAALEGFRARLDAEDLSGLRSDYRDVEGDWIERCVLELPQRRAQASAPGGSPWRYRFSRYGTLPLALSRVVRIVEEVGAVAEGERGPGLPEGYEPVRGDVLERTDGARFRVVALTGEGKGVELRGVDSPLTIYVPLEELAGEFVDLVSRKEGF
ncbi:MAG: hypothetical protein ACLF0P_13460 [Thermoanaerobaculia bacterium]